VSSKAVSCKKVPNDIKEFVDGFGALIVSNLKASGFARRSGFITLTSKAVTWFKKEFGLNKTTWKSIEEQDFRRFDWDQEIYRAGDPNDISKCLNLELKLNKERQNNYFGRDRNGKIIAKKKNHMPKLNFKFSRRIQDDTSQAQSLESSIDRSNQNNLV